MMFARPLTLLRAAVLLCVIAMVSACASPAASTAPTTVATTTPTTAAVVPTAGPTSCPPEGAPAPDDTPPDQVSGKLSVFDWSGYEEPGFWTDFGKKYKNVDVSFPAMGGSDADIYNGIKTGTNTSDVFHPYTGWLQFYVDEGLAAEIDTTKLKNWDKVPESFKALGRFNCKQYFVPWDWGFSSIVYRTDKIPKVDSWSALLDPAYNGHIMMWDDGPGAVTVSSYIHGWDETAITADQLAQAKTEWTAALKANPTTWLGEPDLIAGFQTGDVWAGYGWQSAYATLLPDLPMAYADPKEGRNSWVGVYGIRKDSPNYDLALRFLDEKLGFATGEYLVNTWYFGTSNADVIAAITDENLKEAFSVDDPSILQHTNFTPNLTAAQRDAWIAMWSEAKIAAGS
jgi:spermidine/putrescine transport system substrate-binding protein